MEKLKNIRHGDLALIGVNKLPDGLKASKSNVLMTGSGAMTIASRTARSTRSRKRTS